ncbi:hypothetical protein [Xanthomarina sp. F2636L]|uniref:hypothetical protein n=1 Tax=Xanthomarina sp. F2636L TaxID=2996018 RepID=UPI00225DDB7A|nr:hypothetical protein [Xanthomarina sp. F2636L]MCX7550417.1 hypothetical protein [Xanthomarina sp. F2636L]
MKNTILLTMVLLIISYSKAQEANYEGTNFDIETVEVSHNEEWALSVWTIGVKGNAGETKPIKAGQLDGAPVLGYVFPTNLKPTDVGFSETDGILALALTSHPDFDDTPLWDENADKNYLNDGIIWHPHWVVLVKNELVPGGLAVKQFKKGDTSVTLTPTNPGMPMFMDSPGFQVITKDHTITVIVPDYRINHQINFNFDGVTAFLKVNTSNPELPMLSVYQVYSVASGNLSLPYTVKK